MLLAAAVRRGRGHPPSSAGRAASAAPAAAMAIPDLAAAAGWLPCSSRGCRIGVAIGCAVPGAVAVAGSAVGGCCSALGAIRQRQDAHHTCVEAYQGPQVEGIREGSEVAVHLQPGALAASPIRHAHGSPMFAGGLVRCGCVTLLQNSRCRVSGSRRCVQPGLQKAAVAGRGLRERDVVTRI